ncbi:MAG TPA: M48 family metalloprotease [Fimbriimonas sp.]|nr:M48 family metalloprotease [Fimbriimonas sp.]
MLAALLVTCLGQAGTPPSQTPTPAQTEQTQLSPKELKAQKQLQEDTEYDEKVGKASAEDAEKHYKLSTNQAYQERVQRVGAEIAKIANSYHATALWGDKRFFKFDYTYKVLQSDDVNAFSLPGGHIYVFEGLMKQIESDDELAGVLSHETAHAAFRHIATLMHESQKLSNITIPAILAAILLGRAGGQASDLVVPGAQLFQQAQESGWSVKAEEAADYGGLQYMMKSPYDPTGMLTFMERLAIEEKMGPFIMWGIFRDHPPGKERAESLMHYMHDSGVALHRSKVTTSFRVTLHPADNSTVEIDFGKKKLVSLGGTDALTRGDKVVTTLNGFFDASPEMYELQSGGDGTINWRGSQLLKVTREDAVANNSSVDALRDTALDNIRTALFGLGFHIWASHD